MKTENLTAGDIELLKTMMSFRTPRTTKPEEVSIGDTITYSYLESLGWIWTTDNDGVLTVGLTPKGEKMAEWCEENGIETDIEVVNG